MSDAEGSAGTLRLTWSGLNENLLFDYKLPVVPADAPSLNVSYGDDTPVPVTLDWSKPAALDLSFGKAARLRGALTLYRSVMINGQTYSAVNADIRLKLDDLYGERRFVGIMAAWSATPGRPGTVLA